MTANGPALPVLAKLPRAGQWAALLAVSAAIAALLEAAALPAALLLGPMVAGILVGEFDDGTCGVEVRVRGIGNPRMDDHAIWIFYDGQDRQWGCTSDIEDRFLPVRCRG